MPSYSFKKIHNYTAEELEQAIKDAVKHCGEHGGLDFYRILNGCDAYYEKRRRKEQGPSAAQPPPSPPPGASS